MLLAAIAFTERGAQGQEGSNQPPIKNSYDQITPTLLGKQTFEATMAKDKADKPGVMARQQRLLEERYDLSSRPDKLPSTTSGAIVIDSPW